MAEISNNPQVNNEAWQFYAEMKSENDKLNQDIQQAGDPDSYDSSNSQSINS